MEQFDLKRLTGRPSLLLWLLWTLNAPLSPKDTSCAYPREIVCAIQDMFPRAHGVPKCLVCGKSKRTLSWERGVFTKCHCLSTPWVHSRATFGHPLAIPAFSIACAATAILSNTLSQTLVSFGAPKRFLSAENSSGKPAALCRAWLAARPRGMPPTKKSGR